MNRENLPARGVAAGLLAGLLLCAAGVCAAASAPERGQPTGFTLKSIDAPRLAGPVRIDGRLALIAFAAPVLADAEVSDTFVIDGPADGGTPICRSLQARK